MAFTPSIVSDPAALGPLSTTPGSVGGNFLTQKYIVTQYDYNPFAILNYVIQRHQNKFSDFRMLLKMFGFTRGVDAPVTGHYEQDWWQHAIKVAAVTQASTGVGTTVIFTLHADSMYAPGMTVSGSAKQASEVRVGDIIEFGSHKNARVMQVNTSVSPHAISVKPDAAVDLAGAILANTAYMKVTSAFAEASDLPTGLTPRVFKYTNKFQIVKDAQYTSGSELTNRTFVNFTQLGQGNGPLFAELAPQAMTRFEQNINGALLFGQDLTGLTELNTPAGYDVDIRTTEGILRFGLTAGHDNTYTPGSLGFTGFNTIGKLYYQERAGVSALMPIMGYDLFAEIQLLLQTQLANDQHVFLMKELAARNPEVTSDDLQPFSNKDYDFYVGFKALHYNGMTYYFKLLHEFNSAHGGGLATYDYPKWAVFLPMGMTRDIRSGKDGFMAGYEYKELGGYSRENIVGQYGGVGVAGSGGYMPMPVHGGDWGAAGMVSEIAFHGACPNQVVVLHP